MKTVLLAMACLFAVGVAQADDKGGSEPDAAPPPHKPDDGYRGRRGWPDRRPLSSKENYGTMARPCFVARGTCSPSGVR